MFAIYCQDKNISGYFHKSNDGSATILCSESLNEEGYELLRFSTEEAADFYKEKEYLQFLDRCTDFVSLIYVKIGVLVRVTEIDRISLELKKSSVFYMGEVPKVDGGNIRYKVLEKSFENILVCE